jgi:hypothetical protein
MPQLHDLGNGDARWRRTETGCDVIGHPDLTGSLCAKQFDRTWLGKELSHAGPSSEALEGRGTWKS